MTRTQNAQSRPADRHTIHFRRRILSMSRRDSLSRPNRTDSSTRAPTTPRRERHRRRARSTPPQLPPSRGAGSHRTSRTPSSSGGSQSGATLPALSYPAVSPPLGGSSAYPVIGPPAAQGVPPSDAELVSEKRCASSAWRLQRSAAALESTCSRSGSRRSSIWLRSKLRIVRLGRRNRIRTLPQRDTRPGFG